MIDVLTGTTTARINKVTGLLEHISKTYGNKRYPETEEAIKNGLIFAFTELNGADVEINDVKGVVKLLLGKLGSRRNGNDVFDKFESRSRKMLRNSIGLDKRGLSARNVALVYIVVWAIRTEKSS